MSKTPLKPELKLGADRKKVFLLAGLIVVAIIVYFINATDSPRNPSSSKSATPPPPLAGRIDPAVPVAGPGARNIQRGPRGGRGSSTTNFGQRGAVSNQEFRPTLKPKEPIDPARVDPTLRLARMTRLKSVTIEGGSRSLFDFSGAPQPTTTEIAKVKPIIPGAAASSGFVGPVETKPTPPAPPPPPPPIPLKFYGFTNPAKQAGKRAFFLEGEDIFVAGEGELIKNRYKVVRIGVNSAVVEDTSNKHQQTLPLEAEQIAS